MEKELIKYVGTKAVSAAPATRTEAEKIIGRDIKPAEGNDTDEGYLVKYEDGYLSWSPKNVFEKAYQKAETYLDRMLIEKRELAERIKKLSVKLNEEGFEEKVGEMLYNTMKQQLEAMKWYYSSLSTRIGDAIQ